MFQHPARHRAAMPILAGELSETWGAGAADHSAGQAPDGGFVGTLLPRHGRRPVRFWGRALWRVDNRAASRRAAFPCWSDVQAYELADGSFAVCVRHLKTDDDHAVFQDVWHAPDGAGVRARLRGHDAAMCASGGMLAANGDALRQAWHEMLVAMFGAEAAG